MSRGLARSNRRWAIWSDPFVVGVLFCTEAGRGRYKIRRSPGNCRK